MDPLRLVLERVRRPTPPSGSLCCSLEAHHVGAVRWGSASLPGPAGPTPPSRAQKPDCALPPRSLAFPVCTSERALGPWAPNQDAAPPGPRGPTRRAVNSLYRCPSPWLAGGAESGAVPDWSAGTKAKRGCSRWFGKPWPGLQPLRGEAGGRQRTQRGHPRASGRSEATRGYLDPD